VQRAAFPLASVSFLLSGVAALTYQVVWQRLLVLPLGADVYSMTLVVAAFMTGLGLGSLAGGHVADRLSPLRCVLLFVAAEIAVAAFGLASRGIFYDWMYLGSGAPRSSRLSVQRSFLRPCSGPRSGWACRFRCSAARLPHKSVKQPGGSASFTV
jgi:MFS family permease